MRKIEITKMSEKEYMDNYGYEYSEGNLFDYPLEELDYIITDTDIEKLALINNRLYELN